MRVLIVLAHPKGDSFNAALCTRLRKGLLEAGHEADVADLYSEGFDPLLRGPELDTLGSCRPLPDVAAYQERILSAQALALVFPLWWFGIPAILKGFIERVFQEEFAFRIMSTARVQGLLKHRKALILCTTGASSLVYRALRFEPPLKKILGEWTLKSCGIRDVRQVVFYDVVTANENTRSRYLDQAYQLGLEYFQ
jgi:putative NADPH-quinone reductase